MDSMGKNDIRLDIDNLTPYCAGGMSELCPNVTTMSLLLLFFLYSGCKQSQFYTFYDSLY